MIIRSVVEAMTHPALLVDATLRTLACSPSWTRLYRVRTSPFEADPLVGRERAARAMLASGASAPEDAFPPSFEVSPVRSVSDLDVIDGLLVVQTADAPSEGISGAVTTLTDHLHILRDSNLNQLQQLQVDHAIEEAHTLRRALHVSGQPAAGPDGLPTLAPISALIVDDNAANVDLVARMCQMLGISADRANNGAQALERMERSPYDLVFLDVMMPGASGPEVARTIRQRFGDGPCVVGVTAMPDAEGECLLAGMDAVFLKPMRLDMVSSSVELMKSRFPSAAKQPATGWTAPA